MDAQLEDLECHFKWKLETNAEKLPEDVIKNVLEKLEIEPLRAVPYQCLLSYLYTIIKRNVNYDEAYECLEKADQLNQSILNGSGSSGHIACKFVAEANKLNIDAIRNERELDHQDRVNRLHMMWNDPDENTRNKIRASVLLVKSLSCLYFGPSSYHIGADAAGESASLAPNLFHDAYLQADLLARNRRQETRKVAPSELELNLWSEAVRLAEDHYDDNGGNDSCVQLSVILVCNAEAIVGDKDMERLAEEKADKAKLLLTGMSGDAWIEKNFKIILKCAKVYRILHVQRTTESRARVMESHNDMIKLLDGLKDTTKNDQILYELAMHANNNGNYDEYYRLLSRIQVVADSPGHIWADLALLRFRSGRNCPQTRKLDFRGTILEYDRLINKYKEDRFNRAVPNYFKGVFYTLKSRPEEAMHWMVKSVELTPTIRERVRVKDRERQLENMQKWGYRDDWLAWYMDNMMDEPDSQEIQRLYQLALAFNPEDEFTLHHYGLNRLRAGDLLEAERLLRKLKDTYDSKKRLLSQVLIRQINNTNEVDDSSITKLEECLTLECKDACDVAVSLLQKMQHPSNTVLIQHITDRLMSSDSLPKADTLLTMYSTRSYKLCAQINHVLTSHTAFFIDTELDTAGFKTTTQDYMQQFLQIKTPDINGAGRGNAMRENRLKASNLFVTDKQFNTPELNDAIVAALKDAKETLDRHFHDFLIRTGCKDGTEYYPHGFSFAKNQIQSNPRYNAEKKKTDQVVAQKLLEMDSMVNLLSGMKLEDLKKSFKAKLPRVLDTPMGDTGETLVDLLVLRESQIFDHEGPWLVLWQSMVNLEKHAKKIDIADLNRRLAKFGSGSHHPPLNAYEMMHRAVEFAEETEVILTNAA